ncbi:MAG: UPF0028 protein YchK [Firmicutes bacterium]|nr:UPF0028 protein YchK [Bacillota bacterium]MDI6705187.1 patatin-like phospholipase family protein [Bacillota bacterium]
MTLGVALSGGSVRGMSHIGALRALEEEGLKPDMVAGTSAGSIVASLYATGMSLGCMEEAVLKHARHMIDFDLSGMLAAVMKIGPLFKGYPVIDGLVKGNRIESIMRKLTEEKKMSQANIPLAITATDVIDGGAVVFVSSKKYKPYASGVTYYHDVLIAEAVRASIAIPVIFRPKMIEVNGKGRRLIDGGVVNNLPIDVLKSMGARKIIGINLGYSGDRQEGVDNIIEIGNQSIDIMTYHITKLRNRLENVIELVFNGKPVFYPFRINQEAVVVNPQIFDISIFDYRRIPECIERGYTSMKQNLPEVRKILRI